MPSPAHARTLATRLILCVCLVHAMQWAGAQVNVATQHNDGARTGTNLQEVSLTPRNVNKHQFGMLFKHPVDDQLYTQPLVLTNVHIGGGTHDVVFVTTVNNSVYAFDANDPLAALPFWHVNFGTPAGLADYDFGCLDMNGNMGIVGTPVIDEAAGVLYVVSLTRVAGRFEQRLHALDAATGSEMPQSPATITAPDFNPLLENQRPALVLSHGAVYIGYSSHCDKAPYHGFLLSYDAATLKQNAVLNTSPSGIGASIWQSGQAPAVDPQGNLVFSTGNGSWDGHAQLSESFIKTDRKASVLDWFTPGNHAQLDKDDNDLDSAGPLLLPGTSLAVGGGKQGVLYLVDTTHLGHLGDEHAVQHFQATSSHLHSLVYWQSERHGGLLYLWGQRDRQRVYRFANGRFDEQPFMSRPDANEGHPGGMLSLSAHGGRDGILWVAIHRSGDSWHESRPGILHAYDADNIAHELWNSREIPERDDCGEYSKMAPPTIANGMVYLASFGDSNIGTGRLCAYGLLPSGAAPAAPTGVKALASGKAIKLTWTAVPGARFYTVERQLEGQLEGHWQAVASGLTSTTFEDHPSGTGPSAYRVLAASENGAGLPSSSVTAPDIQAPQPRTMTMP